MILNMMLQALAGDMIVTIFAEQSGVLCFDLAQTGSEPFYYPKAILCVIANVKNVIAHQFIGKKHVFHYQ